MEEQRNLLGRARLIATMLYVVPLVAFPWVGLLARKGTEVALSWEGRTTTTAIPLDPKVIGVLAPALLFVAITDYAVSLFLEAKMLGQARSSASPARQVLVAAVVVSALGASLALYGLVLTWVGAPAWGGALYVLCAVHGLHLMMRWPSYAAAAEQTDPSA